MINLIKSKTKKIFRIKSLKGFGIAEAMLALIVTIFCIEILTGILGVLKAADKKKSPINDVAFSYVQLNEFIKDENRIEIDKKNSNSKQIVLKKLMSVKDEKPLFKSYSIEQYKSMIRIRGVSGGHMPLFLNVKSVKFNVQQTTFRIELVENDGRLSQLIFRTDEPFRIEDNKKENNEDEKQTESTKNEKEDDKSET